MPGTEFKVVINHEEQYSIWPVGKKMPLGWNDVGKAGSKDTCLKYIEEVWTDLSPATLKVKLDELKKL